MHMIYVLVFKTKPFLSFKKEACYYNNTCYKVYLDEKAKQLTSIRDLSVFESF